MNRTLLPEKVDRIWGYYRVLHDVPGCKVKELVVFPKQTLSMQRHFKRREHWVVASGKCEVYSKADDWSHTEVRLLDIHQSIDIPVTEWHRLANPYDIECSIIEIQYGELCQEDDIERL